MRVRRWRDARRARLASLTLATAGAAAGAIVVSGALARTVLIVAALIGAGGAWAELRRRERRATTSSIVFSGLALLGLYLSLAAQSGTPTPTAPAVRQTHREPFADGDIAQVRNVTRHSAYGDPAVAADGDVVRYRLRLENVTDAPVPDVRIRLLTRSWGGYAVIEPTFASTSSVRGWPRDEATVNYVDSAGPLVLDHASARLTDADGDVLRRLPLGIDQAGVSIGDVDAHAVVHLEALASMPPEREPSPQISGGDNLRARNVSLGERSYSDPVLARPGDRLLLGFRVHNAARALSGVRLRATIPVRRATFARVRVTASSSLASPSSTSDTVIVNFARGARLRLRPRYGTTNWLVAYGHDDACPKPSRPRPLIDGIDQGGVVIGPVGYADLDDDCSETTAYVHFMLQAVR